MPEKHYLAVRTPNPPSPPNPSGGTVHCVNFLRFYSDSTMKRTLLVAISLVAVVASAQVTVWENMDACSGYWTYSATVGPKQSFRPAIFDTTNSSPQGGCNVMFATADTFHKGSTVGFVAHQKPQVWNKGWVNMLVYSKDAGTALTVFVADDQDGDTLTVNDVDTLKSTSKVLSAGWNEISYNLTTDFIDQNPTRGNNVLDSTIRSLTFRFTTDASYVANDTVRIGVDLVQNSDTTGFSYLTHTPATLTPIVLAGDALNVAEYLQNGGSAYTPIMNAAISGPAAARFALTRSPSVLNMAGRDSFVVRYSSTNPGIDDATLTFNTQSVNDATVTVPIHATADTAVCSAGQFWLFAGMSIPVGASFEAWCVVKNTGRVRLTMLTYDSIAGPGAADYSVQSAFHGTIAPGKSDSIKVRFSCSAQGYRVASMRLFFFRTATRIDSIWVPLLGAGGTASINATPFQVVDSIVLGDSAYYTIQLENYGNYGAKLTNQGMRGNDSTEFRAVRVITHLLDPFIPDSVIILFKPRSLGVKYAYYQAVTDAKNQPIIIVPLTAFVGTRILTVNPAQVFAGDTALTGSRISRSVLCTSTGTLPITISNVVLVGSDTTHSFTVTRRPKMLLQPGESDTLSVDFAPLISGIKSDTVRLTTSSPSQRTVDLSLLGFAGERRIILSDTTVVDTPYLDVSKLHCFTVKDSGNLPITIAGILIGGTNADQFLLARPTIFPHIIQPGHTDSICILMRPTTPGIKRAQMLISSDAQNTPNAYVNLEVYATVNAVNEPFLTVRGFEIFPNPVTGASTVRGRNGERILACAVLDLLGRTVQVAQSLDGTATIDLTSLPAGSYFVHVATRTGITMIPVIHR
jgi:hypothetical protein